MSEEKLSPLQPDSGSFPVWEEKTQILQTIESSERLQHTHTVVHVSEASVADPKRPYNADRCCALQLAEGQGGCIVVADGIGAGGFFSQFAAESVIGALRSNIDNLSYLPYFQDAKELVLQALERAAIDIEQMREALFDTIPRSDYKLREVAADQIQSVGTTVSLAITCLDEDSGEKVLLVANRGDSKVEVVDLDAMRTGENTLEVVTQITQNDIVHEFDEQTGVLKEYLSRSVRPPFIQEMRQRGTGLYKIPLTRNMVVIARTDGWDKLISTNLQAQTIIDYCQAADFENDDGLGAQYLAQFFIQDAYETWGELTRDKFLMSPTDDISVAVMTIQHNHNASSSERR